MAKHGRRRRFRPYLKGKIDITMVLGTLATKDVTVQVEAGTVDETAWLSSIRTTWSLSDFTAAAGDGPVYVGVAHSDYSGAEIEEWIENTASWTRGDLVNQETAKRKIRQVGIFNTPDAVTDSIALNDGRPITTKCGWILVTGATVKMWAYNAGVGALGDGSAVHVLGHANLWPTS